MPTAPLPSETLLNGAEWVNRVPAGAYDVDVFMGHGGLLALRHGVAGTEELPEIPEVVAPFNGYVVPMGISVRESNGLIERSPELRTEAHIVGVCRWQVDMCGVVAYGGTARTTREGAMLAAGTMERLIKQMETWGVRWWDPDNWRGRRIWYQGVAALVLDIDPQNGRMFVAPEQVDGEPYMDFPEVPAEAESGQEMARPFGGIYVDMLDPAVGWVRERMPTDASAQNAADTQSDAVMVSSEGGPPEDAPSTSHPDTTDTETPPGPSSGGVDAGTTGGADTRPEVDDDQREGAEPAGPAGDERAQGSADPG